MAAVGVGTIPSGRVAEQRTALRWRINRLGRMSLAEIVFRVARLAQAVAERYGLLNAGAVPRADLRTEPAPWVRVPAALGAALGAAPYLAAAERLQRGRFDIFALRDIDLGSPPRWNHDPKSGIEAPATFGKLLDYRNPRLVGDIKYLWEPNRHLHLVTLAQAHALSGDVRHLATIRRDLDSWFLACPPGIGANWSSALEVAIRLINWSLTWQLLGGQASALFDGEEGAAFRQRWLDSIYCHARFIRGHLSAYSSANNHLIGEAAGLFIAAVTWPHWPACGPWGRRARKILEREAQLQNATDGVNREQSVSYQQFVLDMLLLPMLAGRAGGAGFSAAYARRIEAMLDYLASIIDAGGHVPMFGDADDGALVRLAPEDGFCNYRSLLATGAILFQRADFAAKAGALDNKTRSLLGPQAEARYRELDAPDPTVLLPVRRVFPEGGYYILGTDFESSEEIRLIVDAGPLGYKSIAAHGHADALSFTLSVGGLEFLIDPGTYAYHTEGAWRAYFRGTAAHNTLRVDACDQSEQVGNFMWRRGATGRCRVWQTSEQNERFEGWHDGYARLPDPVRHTRRITLDRSARRILIEDELQMSGTHDIELLFHFDENCRPQATADGYTISQGARQIQLSLPRMPDAYWNCHRGSLEPLAGWVSRRFDVKQPAPTVRWRSRIQGDCVLRSQINC